MQEIQVKIDIDELRSIYFENNEHKYFFGPRTKKESFYFVFAILVYPFFAWYYLKHQEEFIFILGTIFFSLFIFDFIKIAKPIIKWRKSVEEFLVKVKKIQVLHIKYNQNGFIHMQDLRISKVNWSDVSSAYINERFIKIKTTQTTFLYPKKCMHPDQFNSLCQVILDNVKNVEKC